MWGLQSTEQCHRSRNISDSSCTRLHFIAFRLHLLQPNRFSRSIESNPHRRYIHTIISGCHTFWNVRVRENVLRDQQCGSNLSRVYSRGHAVWKIFVYLAYILVASHSKEQHSAHLLALFDRLGKHGVTIIAAKCELGKPSITFLGYISSAGEAPPSNKVTATRNYPGPHFY